MKGQTEYKHVRTIEFPNMVVRVFSPVLTEEEQNRRMKAIQKASAELLKDK